ncbi:Bug family tripartite tricarboxylate transporter substrate binding protein [Muricoccus aerilatus]|uniref:Bug family tripartite tricarboxylate transporter substrate binding protein n=1 Tax=Muricoccus aerilatus TaxID=452982 RepID=UPI0005C1D43B|nr:tripartite tricarboxylate transporter substrate-binding protein [Roseomonas aerilata]
MGLQIKRRGLLAVGGTLASAAAPGLWRGAAAQALNRPARIILGWPPGGAADIIARLFAERLRGTYASQLVVENRPGAASRLGIEAVKAAAPDGATLLVTPESMLTIYPHIYPRTLRYDGLKDFIPVSGLCSTSFALALTPAHRARNLAEFVSWARQQSSPVPYASPAAGSTPHFLVEELARATRIRLEHVSYRGSGPAMPDLQAGRLAMVITVTGDMAEYERTGFGRIIGVTSSERSRKLPEVPTMAELGHADLTAEEWYGILLPAGTPLPLVEALQKAVADAVKDPDLRASLATMEQRPRPSTAQEFAERIRTERDRWAPIVLASGFSAE